MGRSKYSEKLLDPRWQRRRLQIMERDNWTCQQCYDTETTLNVHHIWYSGRDPWDAPDEALVTLCRDCHENDPPQPVSPLRVEQERMDAYYARCAENREDEEYVWQSMQWSAFWVEADLAPYRLLTIGSEMIWEDRR